MHIVPRSARNPHDALGKTSSDRVNSLLSRMRVNIFPAMKRSKIFATISSVSLLDISSLQ